MFKNYFKTSLRSLMKNPMSSFINIFGLSMAIGICVMLYGFAQWANDIDQFHENKNEVFLITSMANRDGVQQQYGITPAPLGEVLKQDYPQIEKMCRITNAAVVVKHQDKVFHQTIRYVDPSFLQMFSFPLKWGTSSSLADLNSVIINEDMAVKYFGGENPLGKSIELIFGEGRKKEFAISGVAKKFPEAHAIDFDFIINFENLKLTNATYNPSDWGATIDATIIQVGKGTNIAMIETGMNKYRTLQNGKHSKWNISSFHFVALADLYKKAGDIRDCISPPFYNSNLTAIVILSIITLFLLALACFNYINIAIVTAAKRLKEIGVRKVIGATRSSVVTQFLSENIFVTSFALVFGLLIGIFVFIPGFEQIIGFNMGFTLAHPALWVFLVAVLFITGLASGLYPALYISRFEIVTILRGSSKFGKQNPMTKVLLGFQLILACLLITCAVMFTQNTDYVLKRDWGYGQSDVLYAEVHSQIAYEQLNAVMEQNSNVLSLAGSTNHIGKSHKISIANLPPEEHYEVQELSVDASYFSTMGIQLKEGRLFNRHPEADQQKVVVNEELVKNLGWKEAIGQQVEIDSISYEVVGVVRNFHSYHFDTKIAPVVFTTVNRGGYHYLSLKVNKGTQKETYAIIQAQWLKLFPDIPFQGGYQQDVWDNFFYNIKSHGRLMQVVAFITILLAGLGLYGLVHLNLTGRTKEFSIRKVLGAQTITFAVSILKQYALLFIVSLIVAAPASYFLVASLFDFAYKYHVPMNLTSINIAIGFLVLTLLTVVSTQVNKIAKASPVNGLKVE